MGDTLKAACVLVFFCLAAASAQIDCQTCKDNVVKLGNFLTTPEQLHKTIGLLKLSVCEHSDDRAGCSAGVNQYWEGIAKAIFNNSETPNDICIDDGLCEKTDKSLDCASCERLVGKLADLFLQKDYMRSVFDRIGGSLFCGTQSDVTACKTFVDTYAYGGLVLPALGNGLQEKGKDVCVSLGCEENIVDSSEMFIC